MRHEAMRRPAIVLAMAVALVTVLQTGALAGRPVAKGTFVTPTTQGTIQYTMLRAIHGGSEGKYKVAGKGYPGSMYAAVGGGTGMVWYFGTSGIMAGNALVTLQPDGTYSGPIWFFDRKGATRDTGTVTITFI